jgi:hypothetical protein
MTQQAAPERRVLRPEARAWVSFCRNSRGVRIADGCSIVTEMAKSVALCIADDTNAPTLSRGPQREAAAPACGGLPQF